MSTGDPTAARARIEALIAEASPRPAPAAEVLPLLRALTTLPVEELGVLAYHALTGIAPGEEPAPPTRVQPGFPSFASEVIMRALGPAERRPSPQALVIVLETAPASLWPEGPAIDVTTGAQAAPSPIVPPLVPPPASATTPGRRRAIDPEVVADAETSEAIASPDAVGITPPAPAPDEAAAPETADSTGATSEPSESSGSGEVAQPRPPQPAPEELVAATETVSISEDPSFLPGADELARLVDAELRGEGTGFAVPEPPDGRRRLLLIAAAVAVLLVLLIVLGVVVLG